MNTSWNKTIWLKVASIAVLGTFLIQSSSFALDYNYRDVLPEDDFKESLTGFAVSVGMPFVPGTAAGLGEALSLSPAATVTLGTAMGAGLGATPGLVSGNDTAAWIGGIGGGLSGYLGTSARFNAAKDLGSLHSELTSDLSPINEEVVQKLGTEGWLHLTQDVYGAQTDIGLVNFSGAGAALKSWIPALADTEAGANLVAISNVVNPSMQQYANNVIMAIVTQEAGTSLAKAGTLCWGMNPESAQFVGMVGGSTAGWTMAAMTPQGQGMMGDMYQKINPDWADWVNPGAETYAPLKAGLITGLGLGSIQAGINIGLDSALDGKMPDSARMQLVSMGSQALGSMAWGGIVGGLGENAVIAQKLQQAQELSNASYEEYVARGGQTADGQWFGPVREDWYNQNAGNQTSVDNVDTLGMPAMPKIPSMAEMITADAEKYNGFWAGVRNATNGQQRGFKENAIRRGLSGGLSWAAEESGVEPEYASIIGSSGSMLLSNLDIKPFGRLREPTHITSNKELDAVLEPAIQGLASLALTNLRKDKTGVDLIAHDWATMNLVAITHSGAVAAINKNGWDEFGQVHTGKMREFYNDMFSFGTREFGAVTSGTTEELVGASTIYGASQRNSQVWDFSGLTGFANQADKVREAGGNWRLQMASAVSNNPFKIMARQAGGLANYHALRNAEGLTFTALRPRTPYDLYRVDKELAERLEEQNPQLVTEINRWIRESSYPAYSQSPGRGPIRFPAWRLGFDQDNQAVLENMITGIQYHGTEALQKHSVNNLLGTRTNR